MTIENGLVRLNTWEASVNVAYVDGPGQVV